MDKQTFRKEAIKRLRVSLLHLRRSRDHKISRKIEKILRQHKVRSVLFYLPLEMEVDLRPLLNHLRKRCKVFVPFIVEESFKMVEYRLPLEKNSFGIFEPKSHNYAEKKVDVIIVPVIGMDANMQRVGFGKGMYDRFYEKLLFKPVVIFVQRESCISKEKLCDAHDITGDYYLSSKETITN